MSKFITGGDCNVYYEDETGETNSQELEENAVYTITVQAEYKGFEKDVLVFEVDSQEIYVSLNSIRNIRRIKELQERGC